MFYSETFGPAVLLDVTVPHTGALFQAMFSGGCGLFQHYNTPCLRAKWISDGFSDLCLCLWNVLKCWILVADITTHLQGSTGVHPLIGQDNLAAEWEPLQYSVMPKFVKICSCLCRSSLTAAALGWAVTLQPTPVNATRKTTATQCFLTSSLSLSSPLSSSLLGELQATCFSSGGFKGCLTKRIFA